MALSKTKLFEALFSEIVKEGLRHHGREKIWKSGEFENGMDRGESQKYALGNPGRRNENGLRGCDFQYPVDGKTLLPHTAVWIQKNM